MLETRSGSCRRASLASARAFEGTTRRREGIRRRPRRPAVARGATDGARKARGAGVALTGAAAVGDLLDLPPPIRQVAEAALRPCAEQGEALDREQVVALTETAAHREHPYPRRHADESWRRSAPTSCSALLQTSVTAAAPGHRTGMTEVRLTRAGAERLAEIDPLWKALQDHHAAVAPSSVATWRGRPRRPGRAGGSSTRRGSVTRTPSSCSPSGPGGRSATRS